MSGLTMGTMAALTHHIRKQQQELTAATHNQPVPMGQLLTADSILEIPMEFPTQIIMQDLQHLEQHHKMWD
jgi:hypothetical protein